MRRMLALMALWAIVAGTLQPAGIEYDRLLKSNTEDWLTYSGNYAGHRYAALNQINRGNVKKLNTAWIYQVPSMERLQTSPLVADGVMYITVPTSTITALDVRTGRVLWTYRRDFDNYFVRACCGLVNRGLAMMGNLLFMGTLDSHLIAVDARTGKLAWDTVVADYKQGYTITSAPLAFKDKVVVGVGGGEFGVRGFLDAYDSKTGKRSWRFWTVPGPSEEGHDSWSGDSWKNGGAPAWVTGTYDPQLNLLYWGTGNPSPVLYGDRRKGDNLYSASLLAIDPDTGKRRWHFQFTPHDLHDWDANQIPVLIDGLYQGKPRKLLMTANRNAFLYLLDRETGEFLYGVPFAKQNWAKGLDAKGKPILLPDTAPSKNGTKIYPGALGGTNWWSPSYSPQTNLFYVSARDDGAYYYQSEPFTYRTARLYIMGSFKQIPDEPRTGAVRAFQVGTGEKAWEFPLYAPPYSGVLSTAGGLVFGGTMEGNFFALDAASGKSLWQFFTGGEVVANPVSFMSRGRQYVTIAAGHAILTFALAE